MGGPAAVSILAVTLLLPSAAAASIDGELVWTGQAQVAGVLSAGARAPAYMVHRAGPDAAPAYEWTMAASSLLAVEHVREEKTLRPPDVARVFATDETGWTKTTHRFQDAEVVLRLAPTERWGSSALVESHQAGSASWRLDPSADAWHVRVTRPINALMSVPHSAEAAGASYERRVEDRLLRVDDASWTAEGSLKTVVFGWEILVRESTGREVRLSAGASPTYDPATGRQDGTRLEYVELAASGIQAEADRTADGAWTLYTPALHFRGAAQFPEGRYWGLAAELLAPADEGLALQGDLWLATQADAEPVRAWGSTYTEQAAVPAAAAAPPPPALAVAGAATLLLVAAQLLQQLARAGLGLGVGLYARLRDEGGDRENGTRNRILDLVQREPGKNLSQLVRDLDIGWGTAAYHTQLLLRQKRLRQVRVLNRVCFFTARPGSPEDGVQTVLLNQPNYRLVMDVLRGTPGLSQREVAAATGHARQYVSRLVAKLQDAGLVTMVPGPTGRRYYPRAGPAAAPPAATSALVSPAPLAP